MILPFFNSRKGDDERDTLSRVVVHFDLALMGDDDFVGDGQTQP
jgi:hypothetical protein